MRQESEPFRRPHGRVILALVCVAGFGLLSGCDNGSGESSVSRTSSPEPAATPTTAREVNDLAGEIPLEGNEMVPVRWRLLNVKDQTLEAPVLAARQYIAVRRVLHTDEYPSRWVPHLLAVGEEPSERHVEDIQKESPLPWGGTHHRPFLDLDHGSENRRRKKSLNHILRRRWLARKTRGPTDQAHENRRSRNRGGLAAERLSRWSGLEGNTALAFGQIGRQPALRQTMYCLVGDPYLDRGLDDPHGTCHVHDRGTAVLNAPASRGDASWAPAAFSACRALHAARPDPSPCPPVAVAGGHGPRGGGDTVDPVVVQRHELVRGGQGDGAAVDQRTVVAAEASLRASSRTAVRSTAVAP